MVPDALSGIREWEELDRAIRGDWAMQGLTLADPGWAPGDDFVWRGPTEGRKP